jgi:hypothetical protein
MMPPLVVCRDNFLFKGKLSLFLCAQINPYYKKIIRCQVFGKVDLKAAYFTEIGRLSFGSALQFLCWERLGGLLKSYRGAAK